MRYILPLKLFVHDQLLAPHSLAFQNIHVLSGQFQSLRQKHISSLGIWFPMWLDHILQCARCHHHSLKWAHFWTCCYNMCSELEKYMPVVLLLDECLLLLCTTRLHTNYCCFESKDCGDVNRPIIYQLNTFLLVCKESQRNTYLRNLPRYLPEISTARGSSCCFASQDHRRCPDIHRHRCRHNHSS